MFIEKGYMKKLVCKSLQIERSVVYYINKDNKPGRKPSTVTVFKNETVTEERVLASVKELLDHEFLSYGYFKISKQLKMDGFVINKKKVYRIMKNYNLLKPQRIRTSGKRNFIKFRKPQAERPLTYFEMDIKYIYIPQERRNAYLLSIIDVYSRKVIGHVFKRSIRKIDVINLWQSLKGYLNDFKKITIRSDNGSQFIANDVRGYFCYHNINHEFTNIATPEDDGHIEAFHSILEREFLRRNDYTSFDEMKSAIARFMNCYNEERLHGSLNYRSPEQFIKDFNENELNLNENNIENLNELCQTMSDL
jgi:putative transposase